METAREATARLTQLLRSEHAAMADFLVALAEFDRRRHWLALGHAGPFSFLVREVRLSKAAAFQRKVAAELLQKVPEIEAPLRDGRLCMTAVGHLAKVLTPENAGTVLPRFFGLSSREAEAVAAELAPSSASPRRTVVTAVKLPEPATVPAARVPSPAPLPVVDLPGPAPLVSWHGRVPAPEPTDSKLGRGELGCGGPGPIEAPSAEGREARCHASSSVGAEEPKDVRTSPPPPGIVRPVIHTSPSTAVKPLGPDLRRLHVTVTRRFLDKLERAASALSHSHPGATPERILEAGLDLLLERSDRRKGLVKRPREPARTRAAGSTHSGGREPCEAAREASRVPAHVKRQVWARDGGRCQWPLDGGGVCGATHRLEFDHVRPRALGGTSTVDGLRLLCATHNALAARYAFGDTWMDQFTARARP